MPQRYLSHYTLESILGEGGMGTVWRATDTRLARPVAVKLLHPHLARDPGIRQRFYQEAKLMAMLSHPNVVTLLDYIEEGEELGLVMERVEGRSLDRMSGREVGPIVTARALKLFLPLLDAFGYAHAQGIIH